MSAIQDMRETWRPRLAHSVVWMVRVSVPLGFVTMIAQPEAAASVVALVGLVFGLAASLFGIRQWGKNAGVSDA